MPSRAAATVGEHRFDRRIATPDRPHRAGTPTASPRALGPGPPPGRSNTARPPCRDASSPAATPTIRRASYRTPRRARRRPHRSPPASPAAARAGPSRLAGAGSRRDRGGRVRSPADTMDEPCAAGSRNPSRRKRARAGTAPAGARRHRPRPARVPAPRSWSRTGCGNPRAGEPRGGADPPTAPDHCQESTALRLCEMASVADRRTVPAARRLLGHRTRPRTRDAIAIIPERTLPSEPAGAASPTTR